MQSQAGQWQCQACLKPGAMDESNLWLYQLGFPVLPWYLPYTTIKIFDCLVYKNTVLSLHQIADELIFVRVETLTEFAGPTAFCQCQSSLRASESSHTAQTNPFVLSLEFTSQYLLQQKQFKVVKSKIDFSSLPQLKGRESSFIALAKKKLPNAHVVLEQHKEFGEEQWLHVPIA